MQNSTKIQFTNSRETQKVKRERENVDCIVSERERQRNKTDERKIYTISYYFLRYANN